MKSVSAILSQSTTRGRTDYAKRFHVAISSTIDFADNCFHFSATSTRVE